MNTHGLSINGYRILLNSYKDGKPNNIATNITVKSFSFASLLNDLLVEKSIAVTNNDGQKSSSGLEAKSSNSYDSLFDSGFFGDDAVRIVDNRPNKYCSLCGSAIEADGSCPMCIVPTFISGNTRAQNQAIENQHLKNHLQKQGISQMASSAPSKVGSQIATRSASSKK